MKLSGAGAARFIGQPDTGRAGVLLHGEDAMRVALKRQELIAALLGPNGEEEMRLTRMGGGELKKDPARLTDALREVGFFPGQRVVFVEEATDIATGATKAALSDWRPGDAMLVMTARGLQSRSTLRKLFEDSGAAVSIGIYDEPPSAEEVDGLLSKAGVAALTPEARRDVLALSRALDPGDFRQTVEKIGLYKHGDPSPLTPAEVALSAPATVEAELDELVAAALAGESVKIGPLMQRVGGQGAVSIILAAGRSLRQIYALLASEGGPEAALGRMRPPVFGPRRDALLAQARMWSAEGVERALALVVETDLTLRSSSRAPQLALVERALLKLAMMRRK